MKVTVGRCGECPFYRVTPTGGWTVATCRLGATVDFNASGYVNKRVPDDCPLTKGAIAVELE